MILPANQTYKFFQAGDSDAPDSQKSANPVYRFLHDRVQQAAYYLIPAAERSPVHYKMGQRLLKQSSIADKEERIFTLVNQLNHGIEQLTSRSKTEATKTDATAADSLAELNLLASQKANAATAYQAAYDYANAGLKLLSANDSILFTPLTLSSTRGFMLVTLIR